MEGVATEFEEGRGLFREVAAVALLLLLLLLESTTLLCSTGIFLFIYLSLFFPHKLLN